jgi:outer membrane protein
MQLHVKIFVFGLLACPSALMQAAESDNSAAAWTFSQCLDYAYSNNISLQRLVLDNQSDDATLEQSKAQWQPTLGFSTTQGYINYASPSENQTANVYSGSYGLNASWTVFNAAIR